MVRARWLAFVPLLSLVAVEADAAAYDAYDDTGNRTKETAPNGNFLTYSSAGIIHSSGLSVAFGRDAQGRITTITDPAGKQVVYTYDAAGNLDTEVVKNRRGATTTYTYDASGYVQSMKDALGGNTLFTYDARGRLAFTRALPDAMRGAVIPRVRIPLLCDRFGRIVPREGCHCALRKVTNRYPALRAVDGT